MTQPIASHALEWAEQGQSSASVLLTAQRLIALQNTLGKQLPPAMRRGFAVAQIKGSELTLLADNAALAAKLRQLTPTLLKVIQDSGWQAESLKIKVATRPNAPVTPHHERQTKPLDAVALAQFDTLRQELREGPLADAVDRLLSHHRQ